MSGSCEETSFSQGSCVPPSMQSAGQPSALHRPPLPCWAAKALGSLEHCEQELLCLRQRQLAELDAVSRALERTILGARREERRLVERVEQDHRDTQCRLEQLQRENCAAERVARALVDQRLKDFFRLHEQIHKHVSGQGLLKPDQLLQSVSLLLQPWEISLTLKRVSFCPSTQHKSVTFGEVHVRELSISFSMGICKARGQLCPVHMVEGQKVTAHSVQVEKGVECFSGRRRPHVRKLHLSRGESVLGAEEHSSSTQLCSPALQDFMDGPSTQGILLSSGLKNQTKDCFEADLEVGQNRENGKKHKRQALEYLKHHGNQMVNPALQYCGAHWLEPIPGERPCSWLDKCPLRTSSEELKASFQKTSLNSSCGISSSSDLDSKSSLNHIPCFSRSCTDLSQRNLSSTNIREDSRLCSGVFQKYSVISQTLKRLKNGAALFKGGTSGIWHRNSERATSEDSAQVRRSLSLSAIERGHAGVCYDKVESLSEEHVNSSTAELGRLLRQFGKRGSGRANFTLPSGIHATLQGQLFVVDCGNARLQVMDSWGNVLQQVSPNDTGKLARHCSTLFDVAVNAKGLIALSCAVEGVLLVFNRHGRHLQTFGRTGLGAKDDIQAPRGVAVSHLDQFLVADLRGGTLFVLKLDSRTGMVLEQTEVQGFHHPYLVSAHLSTGLVAVSEKGGRGDRVPCIKVLDPGWTVIRRVGVCPSLGPVLSCPQGLCIDGDGTVLVSDWGYRHRVMMYSAQGVCRPVVSEGLDKPRGLALLPEGHLVVCDSMHHCLKVFLYK